ncbi:MAG: hypothetical protein QOC61_373 [Acidobacteriota bacterium]|nr:hypothetical protein [Acidobacteriota bacterium]
MPFCHVRLSAKKPKSEAYPVALITLGDHLRAKRLDRGLFQKQVADKIGVEVTSIYNWENNRGEPAVRFIPRVHLFLGYCPYTPGLLIPDWLRLVRQSLGYSQEVVAKEVGVDETTWRRWEAGGRLPAPLYIGRIKHFLEALVSY